MNIPISFYQDFRERDKEIERLKSILEKNNMRKNTFAGSLKLDELKNQLERSAKYNHTTFSIQTDHINEIESYLYGLIDTLLSDNSIEQSVLKKSILKVKEEILEKTNTYMRE